MSDQDANQPRPAGQAATPLPATPAEKQPDEEFGDSVIELVTDIIEEKAELKPFHKFYKTNKQRVRKWISFIIIVGLIFGYFGYSLSTLLNEKSVKEFAETISKLSASIQADSVSNEELSRQVQEKNHQIEMLDQEKNKSEIEAENAKNATAELRMLVQNIDTNNPLATNMKILISKIDQNLTVSGSASNFEALIESERPQFSIFINKILITNNSLISLKKSRKIQIDIKNDSKITAENVFVTFSISAAIDLTNLTYSASWHPLLGASSIKNGQLVENAINVLAWKANASVAANTLYAVDSVEVSTNFTGYPVVTGVISAYADKSQRPDLAISLIFY